MLLTSAGLSCPYAYVVPMKLIIIFKEQDTSLQRKVRIKHNFQTLYTWTHFICHDIKRKKKRFNSEINEKMSLPQQHNQRVKEVTADTSQMHYKVKSAWWKKYCIVTVKAVNLFNSPPGKKILLPQGMQQTDNDDMIMM